MSLEIEKKLDELGQAINIAQDSFSRGIKDTSDNAKEAVTDLAQKLQDEQAKVKSMQEQVDFMSKKISRFSLGSNEIQKERENKFKDEFTRYLRKGEMLNNEICEDIVKSTITDKFLGFNSVEKENITKNLVAGSNPDGGYFVRPDFSNQLVTRIFETSPIRQYANVVTTNSDVYIAGIDDNQPTDGGWVGEVSSRDTTSTPQIGLLEIPVHEIYAQPLASQKMIDDAGFDLEAWLSRKVVEKISRDENTAFVAGDGSRKPKGFLSYPDYTAAQKADSNGAYGRKAIERVNSGTNGAITADGIKFLQNSLKEDYQANAIFGVRRKSFEDVITLKDNQDRYIFNTRFLQEERTLSLLGRPVVFMNDMPDVATDSLSMVYGDFSMGYTIVDRFGIRVLRDAYTSKPYVKYYTTKRVGGDVSNYEAIKLLQLSA